jgi:16S rRNA processing protein RimM
MMLLLGPLVKVQGLKGEFLLHPCTDSPERIHERSGLILAPQGADLSESDPTPSCQHVSVRTFRWHQGRPCLAFDQISDRTAAEPFKGWALWMPEASVELQEGESYRHDWVGCQIFVNGEIVGEVLDLAPYPGGYDMVSMKDLRSGRHGVRDIPYIKAWFTLDLDNRRIDLDPPDGLLDLDRLD